jgi:solute carrier family 3, member 2
LKFQLDRFKSGNPGYFVVLNPTNNKVEADFSAREDLPDELTVTVMSENYNVEGIQIK